ncbi:MAG: phosphoribosylglycinamide formyltransferase [Planctomycetaceae bacterium]|nr:phosphoribosylglycinamide formyltransferase [Planctomycetaceae bacterium]
MTAKPRLRLGCLISGGGRTVLNLQTAIERDAIPAEIAVVVAHRADLPGVERCRGTGLPVRVVSDPASPRIDEVLIEAGVELVCLCGYLRHFAVEPRWSDRVVNIHPSLLPKYGGRGMYGDRVHAAVLEAGDVESGCTVHAVDEIYDHGAVILQERCPVHADDTTSTLAARVFETECVAMPAAIRGIAEGRIRIEGGRIIDAMVDPPADPT